MTLKNDSTLMTTVILDLRKTPKAIGIEGLTIDRYRPHIEENKGGEATGDDKNENDEEEQKKEIIHDDDEDLFT